MHVAMTSTPDPCAPGHSSCLNGRSPMSEIPLATGRWMYAPSERERSPSLGCSGVALSPPLPDERLSKESACTARGLGNTTQTMAKALAAKTLGVGDHGSTPGRVAERSHLGVSNLVYQLKILTSWAQGEVHVDVALLVPSGYFWSGLRIPYPPQ